MTNGNRSLAILGIGLAAGTGGAYAGHEAFARADVLALQHECAKVKQYEPWPEQCVGVDTSPEATEVNDVAVQVYSTIGTLLVIGSGIALICAASVAMKR